MLDNPLHLHPEYVDELNAHFERAGRREDQPAICWVKEGMFRWRVFAVDPRVTRVYNIPHLAKTRMNQPSDFFVSTAKVLLEARKAAISAAKNSNKPDEILAAFVAKMIESLVGTEAIRCFARFFNLDEDVAFKCVINSVSYTLVASAGYLLCLTEPFTQLLTALTPMAALGTLLVFHFATKDKFARERALNCTSVLNSFFDQIRFFQEKVVESNVFVTAIDERNYCSLLPWSFVRKNYGGWCEFLYLRNLPNAPRARDITQNGQPRFISTFLDIIQRIFTDEHLNPDRLDKYINGQNLFRRVYPGPNNDNAENPENANRYHAEH